MVFLFMLYCVVGTKCDITFLLVHLVISYPCFASYRYPQKHGRKKIYVPQKFCMLDNVKFFFFLGLLPITMFHGPDVNRVSQTFVDAHSRNWPTNPYAGKKTVR